MGRLLGDPEVWDDSPSRPRPALRGLVGLAIGAAAGLLLALAVVPRSAPVPPEVRLPRAAEAPKLLRPRADGHEYYADHHGEHFYIWTNDRGKNFRLISAPVADPRPENWKEVIAHRPGVMLEGVSCFADHYVAFEREDAASPMAESSSGQCSIAARCFVPATASSSNRSRPS